MCLSFYTRASLLEICSHEPRTGVLGGQVEPREVACSRCGIYTRGNFMVMWENYPLRMLGGRQRTTEHRVLDYIAAVPLIFRTAT